MPSAVQAASAAPHRRAIAAKSVVESTKPKARKMSAASVEATADAFMVLFKGLSGAAKTRIAELIEEYEDELDAQEVAAARAADPEGFDPAKCITLEDYMSQRRARDAQRGQ